MKILIVGSLNSHAGKFAPFIVEQAEALQAAGCDVEYFGITGKGIIGYLKALPKLRKIICEKHIDVVHAHYGLCCLLANLQRIVPVVSTYHGSDINNPKAFRYTKWAMRLSQHNIFVSQRTMAIAVGTNAKTMDSLIPCGINLPKDASDLPNMNHVLESGKKHVLFAGAFDNDVKDPKLALQVIEELNLKNEEQVQLIELRGYCRDEVNALMYACDAFLMTSKTEGSPQVIKEAMACGCPIVSVDVGDVKERLEVRGERLEGTSLQVGSESRMLEGCFVAQTREPEELTDLIMKALKVKQTNGREKLIADGLTNDLVAEKLIKIYREVLK